MPKVATLTATIAVSSVDPWKRSLKLTVCPLTLNFAPEAPPMPPPMITRVVPPAVVVPLSAPAAAASAAGLAPCASAEAAQHGVKTDKVRAIPPTTSPLSFFFLERLVQRFQLYDRRAVIAADPERHRRGRVVDEHPPDVGLARQQIVDHLPRLRVDPRHLVGDHRARPRLLILVDGDVVRRRPGRGHLPFAEALGFRLENHDT